MAKSSENAVEESKKPAQRVRMTREERRAIVSAGRQYINPELLETGYHHCLVNETPENVSYYESLGYELARDSRGAEIRRVANMSVGSIATHAVLMRIPDEEYKDIESLREEKNDSMIESIKPRKSNGEYGTGVTFIK